jgi:NAD(P)-dependent dehydrogenase (short-subunit alcohol dehydrogenase family)
MTRTVLVTGCSTGIGNSCVRVFHREGWNVVATLRRAALIQYLNDTVMPYVAGIPMKR